MKYAYLSTDLQQGSDIHCRIRISKRNAYHVSGHAAAIYLGNKKKQLPEVFFKIVFKPHEQDERQLNEIAAIYSKYHVKIEGGRLIQSLPLSFAEATRYFSGPQQEKYRCAFEADVINLLAGPLAEAKYVAWRDNEAFNANLINHNALHFYGGNLAVINEYMEWFLPNKEERDRKLAELFLAAFRFVDKRANWHAITTLAEFIQDQPNNTINCEEIIFLLESRLEA